MKFDIYCGMYNEEWLLPRMVEWYRDKLSGHEVVFHIYDNESTDDTAAVARGLGCNVIYWETDGKLSNLEGRHLCNNMWKGSDADYVIIICCDEFIDINPDLLRGCTIAKCIGYNMVGDHGQTLEEIDHGVRAEIQDKCCIFSPKDIEDINYLPGAHKCQPTGNVVYNDYRPIMYHMNMLSEEWIVFRYRRGRERLGDLDQVMGWGAHFEGSDEDIARLYQHAKRLRIKIR